MNPPKFTGTKVEEDPQVFVDEMEKIFKVMHVDEVEGVELATYQLKDVANQWYADWEKEKGESAEHIVWGEFVEAFLDRFFPMELREAKVEEFMNLKQGSMSVQEYTLKFNKLACYAPELTSNIRAQMRKFSSGLADNLVLECQGAMLNKELDFAQLTIHMQRVKDKKKKIAKSRDKDRQSKRDRSVVQHQSQLQSGNWGNKLSNKKKFWNNAQSAVSAPAPRPPTDRKT